MGLAPGWAPDLGGGVLASCSSIFAQHHLAIGAEQHHLRHAVISAVGVVGNDLKRNVANRIDEIGLGDEILQAFDCLFVFFVVGGQAQHRKTALAILLVKRGDVRRVFLAMRAI